MKRADFILKQLGAGTPGPSWSEKTFSVVQVLELNRFIIVPLDELQKSHIRDIHVVRCDSKMCRCIIVHSGGKSEMERLLQIMVRFTNTAKKFKCLGLESSTTQTEIVNQVTAETQTEDVNQIPAETQTEDVNQIPAETQTEDVNQIPAETQTEDVNQIPAETQTEDINQHEMNTGNFEITMPADFEFAEYTVSEGGQLSECTPLSNVLDPTISTVDQYESVLTIGDVEDSSLEPEKLSSSTQEEEILGLDPVSLPVSESGLVDSVTFAVHAEFTSVPEELSCQEEKEMPGIDPILPVADSEPVLTFDVRDESEAVPEEPCSDDEEKMPGPEETTKLRKNRQFCIFCNSLQTQLPRHLLRSHPNEKRVQDFADLPQKHPDRLSAIRKLRMEGYVQSKNIKSMQPVKGGAMTNFVQCSECQSMYSKKNFYRHYRKCSGKRAKKNTLNIMQNIQFLKDVDPEQTHTDLLSQEMKVVILPRIIDKKIVETIINDKELIGFGNSLCLRFGNEIKKHENLIRQKLRTVAKCKLQMSSIDNEIGQIIDIFDIKHWDLFVNTIKDFSKLHETDIEKKSPSNVKHLGLLFSNLAKDLEVTCTDEIKIKQIKRWLKLYNRKYQSSIGWQANKLSVQKKWKKKKFLPLAEDITKLNSYIRKTMSEAIDTLKSHFSYSAWISLNESVMIMILCFNRKRVGEIMTVTLDDFLKKDKVNEGTDVWNSLSTSERNIASQYFHLQIRGKFARPVPLLISTEVANAIDLIIKYREEAGVSKENPFLFAKRGDETSKFDANVVLREVSEMCGAKRPQDLRSRNLRTHIATVSQALNLSDTDLKVLSGFLGHTTKTHLEHYRMPSDIEHTARLSKLLHALDSGTIHKYRGKSINEIDYDEDITEDTEESHHDQRTLIPEPSTMPDYEDQPAPIPGPSTMPDYVPVQLTPKKPKIRTPLKGTPSPTKSITPKKIKIKWTADEIKIMRREFKDNLKNNTLPSFYLCNEVRKKYQLLSRRKAAVMKAWVYNQNKKKKKDSSDSD